MIESSELIKILEEERDFEIKQLGNCYEEDELINIGATVYTLTKVIDTIKKLEGDEDNEF